MVWNFELWVELTHFLKQWVVSWVNSFLKWVDPCLPSMHNLEIFKALINAHTKSTVDENANGCLPSTIYFGVKFTNKKTKRVASANFSMMIEKASCSVITIYFQVALKVQADKKSCINTIIQNAMGLALSEVQPTIFGFF